MKVLQEPFNRPYSAAFDLRQFGLVIICTSVAMLFGWLLTPWMGIIGAYIPLLASVALVTWFGGLLPSLTSQVLGAGATLLFTWRSTGVPITATDLYAVLLFLLIAKLVMFLLLNIRFNLYLQQSRTHLEMMAQSTHDTLWEWDLATNRVWRNGKVAEIFGCGKEEIKPDFDWWRQRVHPDDKERIWAGLRRSIDIGDQHWSDEYQLRRSDGTYATISDHGFIIRNKKGAAIRMFGGMADISAQRKAEQHLAYHTSYDTLTGLPNRELFVAHLDRLLKRSRYQEDGRLPAVLVINIDRFKAINDSLGRPNGDQVLIAVASRLTRCLRPQDMAARLDGDEFVALLDAVESTGEAVHVAERVQQSLLVSFHLGNQLMSISASIGISFAESVKAEEMIQQADLAMHQAKAQGRGRCLIFEPAIEVRARSILQAETELRRSFEDASLQLYYQPMVSLKSGRISGFEALLRWKHPERGLVGQGEILPIAEEAGLLSRLEQWVLQNSCACLGRWKRECISASALVMSFNLSGKELSQPSLVREVEKALRNADIDAKSLLVEVTETAMAEDNSAVTRNLADLAGLGIRLAIDDFGKGYSSLGRLQDFPVSTIKIASLFVHRIGMGKPDMLEAILALAHKLHLEIIAEGVETEEQLRYLLDRGVDFAQGLYFSPVLSQQSAYELLIKQYSWKLDGRTSVLTRGTGSGSS